MEAEQNIGLWIGTIRKRRGLTQAQLAARIGRSANAVSTLECGRNVPTIGTLRRLARALGVPMGAFFAPAGGTKHDTLLGELLDAARTLPLPELQMTVEIVGIVAKRCAERAG